MARPENLQYMTWNANIQKGRRLLPIARKLIDKWETEGVI